MPRLSKVEKARAQELVQERLQRAYENGFDAGKAKGIELGRNEPSSRASGIRLQALESLARVAESVAYAMRSEAGQL
jgi:hypothetical protein